MDDFTHSCLQAQARVSRNPTLDQTQAGTRETLWEGDQDHEDCVLKFRESVNVTSSILHGKKQVCSARS